MTDYPRPYEMDIQLHSGFSILNVNPVPGVGELTLKLNPDELDNLRDLAVEAVLVGQGYTEEIILAGDIETGDRVPGFPPVTEAVRQGHKIYILFGESGCEAAFPYDHHLTVHRRIS